MWLVLALLSALFAALTSILAKIGIEGVNSNLATAIRTSVVLLLSWGMVFLTSAQNGISGITQKSWLFLILSGLATGASWLCYYKALQLGEVSKVVPIDKMSVIFTLILAFVFLHEQFTVKSAIGTCGCLDLNCYSLKLCCHFSCGCLILLYLKETCVLFVLCISHSLCVSLNCKLLGEKEFSCISIGNIDDLILFTLTFYICQK